VRVQQEKRYLFRGEIRPARNRGEGRNIGTGLSLLTPHDMAGGAPAFGEIGAVIGIGGHRSRSQRRRGGHHQNKKAFQTCRHQAIPVSDVANRSTC